MPFTVLLLPLSLLSMLLPRSIRKKRYRQFAFYPPIHSLMMILCELPQSTKYCDKSGICNRKSWLICSHLKRPPHPRECWEVGWLNTWCLPLRRPLINLPKLRESESESISSWSIECSPQELCLLNCDLSKVHFAFTLSLSHHWLREWWRCNLFEISCNFKYLYSVRAKCKPFRMRCVQWPMAAAIQ